MLHVRLFSVWFILFDYLAISLPLISIENEGEIPFPSPRDLYKPLSMKLYNWITSSHGDHDASLDALARHLNYTLQDETLRNELKSLVVDLHLFHVVNRLDS